MSGSLVAVTRVLNEEDVIEAFARHHAVLVDHHIFLDNGSSDRTVEILLALAGEGLRLTLLQNAAAVFCEEQFNSGLYYYAVQTQAPSWVLYLDADEFIDTRLCCDLRAYLASMPGKASSLGVQLVNYDAPSPETADEANVARRLIRRQPTLPGIWKVFVRGTLGAGRVAVAAGNHHIFLDGSGQKPHLQDALRLAHYPGRSPWHWAAKAVTGRLKVLAAGQREIAQDRAMHYTSLFEQLTRDPLPWLDVNLDHARRMQTSPELIDDPIAYAGGALRYTGEIDYRARSLSLVLAAVERIARSHGELIDASPELRGRLDAQIGSVKLLWNSPPR